MSIDPEEYLLLLNLKLQPALVKVHPEKDQFGEQGWLNEVYLEERLDIGMAYNAFTFIKHQFPAIWAQVEKNITIIHFAGNSKPGNGEPCPSEVEELCEQWRGYRARVQWEILVTQ